MELQTGFILDFINCQLRLNQMMSSRASAWIHVQFDECSLKNQSSNEPDSPRPKLNASKISKPHVCDGLGDYER